MSERQSIYERLNRLPVTARAERAVFRDRAEEYGPVLSDFERTAELWSAVLRCPVSAEAVALCLILVKISRLCFNPSHLDSVVDIAGYAEILGLIQGEREMADRPEQASNPSPSCPDCGDGSSVPGKALRALAAQDLALKCGKCGRISPASAWLTEGGKGE